MEERKIRFPWFGVALILFGTALLLTRFHLLDVRFSQVFWPLIMLFGIATVSRGYTRDRRGKIYWGTVLFLYGLYFFLRSMENIEFRAYMFFPATFLVFGVAFVMVYLHNVRDWFLLIPASILCGIGVLFIMTEYGYVYGLDVWEAIHRYWPVALILIGVAMIMRRRGQGDRSHQVGSPGTTTMMLS